MQQFDNVTELAGEEISAEQLYRLYNRYHWTSLHCDGKDVVELACGAGAGLGYIARSARSVAAGDYSGSILEGARAHYGDRFDLRQFDAQDMPYPDASFDVAVMHEALYYLPDATKFVAECRRVLRPGGMVLLTNANKDLFDFNPSPYSTVYHGAVELTELFEVQGFKVELFGSTPLGQVSLLQKITRPLKWAAVRFGIMPKTMRGKRLLKRLIFGKPVLMPPEVLPGMADVEELSPIRTDQPCQTHKIIYCKATLADRQT